MGEPKLERRYTYEDYCTWPEGERWELIDGIAYAMSPAPNAAHQQAVVSITGQLYAALKGHRCRVMSSPFDVRLPGIGRSREDVIQPDVSVFCDPAKLDEKGAIGAPDVVFEVLSPATASRDWIEKRAIYERNGVKEYWLVHPTDRIVTVFRLEASGRFSAPEIRAGTGTLAIRALEGLVLDLDELYGGPLPEVIREPPVTYHRSVREVQA